MEDVNSEITTAISEFKNNPFNRQKSAKKLIPVIKKGMSSQEIKEILGEPNETIWDYPLFYSSRLLIHFDSEGKVKKVATVGI